MSDVLDFLRTGVVLIMGYMGYALATILCVLLLGAPIYVGVKILDQLLRGLF